MKYQGEFLNRIEEINLLKAKNTNDVEKRCYDLMTLSELANDTYAFAFAQTTLFNIHYLNRDVKQCRNIANDTIHTNMKYHYNDLLVQSYNTLGLYYIMIQDFPEALSALLKGKQKLNKDAYYDMIKFNNNISLCFESVNDLEIARNFQKLSYNIWKAHHENIKQPNLNIFIICNLIDLYIQENDIIHAEIYYKKLIQNKDEIHPAYQTLVDARITQYYEISNQIDITKKMIRTFLSQHEKLETFFAYQIALIEYTKIAIRQKMKEESKQLLHLFQILCMEEDVENRLKYQRLKIDYEETFQPENIIKNSYYDYYMLQKKMIKSANKSKAEGMRDRLENYQLIEENKILKKKSNIDTLAHIYNRSYFNRLSKRINEASSIQKIGILMIDIDYFKEYNDTYGHIAGDKVIVTIANLLKKYSNANIVPCRYGGDEFVCLLIDTSTIEVNHYLNHIYSDLKELNIEHIHSKANSYVTISCGYSIVKNHTLSISELIKQSDKILYKAKQMGRNNYHNHQ